MKINLYSAENYERNFRKAVMRNLNTKRLIQLRLNKLTELHFFTIMHDHN